MASSAKAQRNAAIWQAGYLNDKTQEANNYLQNYYGLAAQNVAGGYDAAMQTTQDYLGGQLDALGQGYQTATGAINDNYGQARSDVTSTSAAGRDALQAGYDTATGAINTGLNQSLAALGTGYGTATDAVNRGISGLQTWVDNGTAASNMYQNALGLNGAEGNTAAESTFQAGPGFEWKVDQTTDAAARKASALGLTASGNTLTALGTLGFNLANQEYDSWLNRLNGVSTTGLTAAQGQQSGYNNLANLATNYGQNQSNLYTGAATNLSNLATGLGTSLNSNYANEGSQLSSLGQNQGNQLSTLASNYGSNVSSALGTAGNQIASAQEAKGNNLGTLYQNLGTGQSNNIMISAGTIANTGAQAMAASNSSNQLNNALGAVGTGLNLATTIAGLF
jgi:hypothetical protein